jgi:uncharacterized membrane protein YeaQ/YmgE (transglycosylase-associated protein family)
MGWFLGLALIGAVAGWIAKRLMDVPLGMAQTVLVGMAGALVGGFLIRFVLPAVFMLLGAVLGAMLVIWAIQRFAPRG